MDAVLPLIARDVPRFELLYRSLQRRVAGLDRIVIVVPDHERSLLSLQASRGGPAIEVLSELELVPELRFFPRLSGWYKQQIIKLEAANCVSRGFYLTLDADVLATRDVDLEALCAQGTAPCAVAQGDWHPRWYAGAEALIGQPLARRGIAHTVTPAILHREAVWALTEHLDARWRDGRYSPGLRGLKQRAGRLTARLSAGADSAKLRGWRIALCCSRPWSEYSLYYSFLECTGRFGTYHHETAEPLYTREQSVWHARDVEAWDPSKLDANGAPFVVLQSTAEIPMEKLRSWAEHFV